MLLALLLTVDASSIDAQIIGPEQAIGVDPLRIDSQPVVAAHGQSVVAVWGHPNEGCGSNFSWTYSADGGVTWSPWQLLGGFSYLYGQPALTADAEGNFTLVASYCELGFYFAVLRGAFSSGSFSWGPPSTVVTYAGDQLLDMPSVASGADPNTLYLAYTQRRHLGRVEFDTFIQFTRSEDSGATWSVPATLSSLSSEGGDLAVGPDGEIYVIWSDVAASQVRGRKSIDGGASFGAEFVVGSARPNYNTLSPGWQGIINRHRAEFPYGEYFASDFPSVAVDRSAGPHRGRVYVTWTEMAPGVAGAANGQEVRLEGGGEKAGLEAQSPTDHCQRPPYSYYEGAVPVAIGADLSGGCPSGNQDPCGCSAILRVDAPPGTGLWIRGDAHFGQLPFGMSPLPWTYTIQCGPDTTQLVDIGVPVLWDVFELDYAPPFVTTLPSAGPYYIRVVGGGTYSMSYSMSLRTYQFATSEPARDQRDLVLASSADGGMTWGPKVRVNDDPPGFDNALAELAVDGFGNLHVAWYDRRQDAACGGNARTYWTVSDDGGTSFRASQSLSGGASPWQLPYSVGYTIGDKLGLWAEGERLHAVWVDFRAGGNPDIFHAAVRDLATSTVVTRFEATAEGAAVRVRWSVSDVDGLVAMTVERAPGAGSGFESVPGGGRAVDGSRLYEVVDVEVARGETYHYRLSLGWRDGRTTYEEPIAVTVPADAGGLALGRPAPTPFTGTVALDLILAERGVVDVRVYDLLGHEVAALQRGELGPGRHALAWNGHGHGGHRLAPGMYVVRARQGDQSSSKNVLMVR